MLKKLPIIMSECTLTGSQDSRDSYPIDQNYECAHTQNIR
jgi:hypothetical protein